LYSIGHEDIDVCRQHCSQLYKVSLTTDFLCEKYPQIHVCPINILDQLFKKPRHLRLMLTEGSFLCPQEPVTAPHADLAESSLHPYT
jgi:hypothetical protein